jgi:hypothetical protein
MMPADNDTLLSIHATGPDSHSTDSQPSDLRQTEVWWSKRYKWLENCGYLLRPRYGPDWIPSWQGTSKDPFTCEDWIRPRVCVHMLDSLQKLILISYYAVR